MIPNLEIVDGKKLEYTPTLQDWASEWLILCAMSRSPLTVESYKDALRRIWLPTLGRSELASVTPYDVQRIVVKLQLRGLAPATIRRYFVVLTSCFSSAVKLHIINQNPCWGIELPPKNDRELSQLSDTEIQKIAAAMAAEPPSWRALFVLAITTGARRGELAALRWCDVDTSAATISISRSAYAPPGGGTRCKTTKTRGSRRVLALPPIAMDALAHLKQSDGYIFGGRVEGAPIYPSSITHRWAKLCARAGIPRRAFHALRHTHASFLIVSGVDIRTVAARLGHVRLETTQRYVHTTDAADRAAAIVGQKIMPALDMAISSTGKSKNTIEATRFELATSTSLM